MCGSTRNSKTVLTVCPWQLQFANSVTNKKFCSHQVCLMHGNSTRHDAQGIQAETAAVSFYNSLMAREHGNQCTATYSASVFSCMEAVHLGFFVRGHATKLLRLPYLKGP